MDFVTEQSSKRAWLQSAELSAPEPGARKQQTRNKTPEAESMSDSAGKEY